MSTTDDQPMSRRRQSAGWILALACVSVLVGAVGVINPGHFALVDRLFHPFASFLAVSAFLIVAAGFFIVTRVRAPARAVPVKESGVLVAARLAGGFMVMIVVAVLATWGAVVFMMLLPTGPPSTVAAAPKGHAYEAVTDPAVAMIDPIWYISIRQNSGLLARIWEVGCLSGDDPANALESVRWEGASRLIIQTSRHGRVVVDVSADNGRPTRVQDPGILGC